MVPALSTSGGAAGSGNKGRDPQETQRHQRKEDPFPAVEEETLSQIRELRLPSKAGDTWEEDQFWETKAGHEAAKPPGRLQDPGKEGPSIP